MYQFIRQVSRFLALLAFLVLWTEPTLAQSQAFAITYPESNSTVSSPEIVVEGVGAVPGATIQVWVYTNDWYLQTGAAHIDESGNWTYAPCHLRGQPPYDRHMIRARITHGDQVTEAPLVRGVVRE